MPDLWQPRQPGAATDLVYRSRFTTAAPDLQWQDAEQFSAWIAGLVHVGYVGDHLPTANFR
jgi:hypothetical protein